MRNLISRVKEAPYRLLAAASVATMATGEAHAAGTGVGGMADTVNNQMDSMGKVLLAGSFLGGLGFAGAGLMKLKAAADSQGREPYGPGLWRLAVGGGLVALPTFTSTFRDTFTGGNDESLTVGTVSGLQ